ncbi:MAG TPA: GNAT family N-acetyltransferase [Candidatus Hydrogenedentes bacterium]|nr:GNAT family N-acetyltransferase [Candidatus Hydrogenedentota bacterium]
MQDYNTGMVHVEEAVEADLNALCAIDRLVIGSSERRSFLSSAIAARRCYKAVVGSEAVGFMVIEKGLYGHAFISFMIVHPGHRREGVASALIDYAEFIAPTDKLFTSTSTGNTDMQRLCESLGFVRSSSIDNLESDESEIVYYKQLEKKAVVGGRS